MQEQSYKKLILSLSIYESDCAQRNELCLRNYKMKIFNICLEKVALSHENRDEECWHPRRPQAITIFFSDVPSREGPAATWSIPVTVASGERRKCLPVIEQELSQSAAAVVMQVLNFS